MSKKKYKKRQHSPTVMAKRQAEQERIADEVSRNRKRMNPVARNILLADLVILALAALLEHNGLIPPVVSGVVSIFGLVLMVIALWVQFGKKNGGGGGIGGPRL